jgi:hypothetical protein
MEVGLFLDPIHGVGLCGILRLAALRGLPSGVLGFGRRSGPILSCPQRIESLKGQGPRMWM